MLQGIRLDPDEEPAVGIPEGPSPVVVTTKRIAWRSGNTLHDVSLGDVVAVNVPEFMEVSKLDLRRLWLVTRSGEEFLLETEPGEPFFVLWNFLLRVIEQPKPVAGQFFLRALDPVVGGVSGVLMWGNLLQKNPTKCGAENLTVSLFPNNQLVGYGYDAASNMFAIPSVPPAPGCRGW